jgi:hypothetical protein
MRYLIAGILTAAALGACNLTDTHTRMQRNGLLRLAAEDSVDWVVPDTVAINTDFNISVVTYGGSCDRIGPTDVIPLPNGTVDFKPFDITEITPDKPCPLVIQTFTHTGTLKVSEVGPKSITLWGREWNNSIMTRVKTVYIK